MSFEKGDILKCIDESDWPHDSLHEGRLYVVEDTFVANTIRLAGRMRVAGKWQTGIVARESRFVGTGFKVGDPVEAHHRDKLVGEIIGVSKRTGLKLQIKATTGDGRGLIYLRDPDKCKLVQKGEVAGVDADDADDLAIAEFIRLWKGRMSDESTATSVIDRAQVGLTNYGMARPRPSPLSPEQQEARLKAGWSGPIQPGERLKREPVTVHTGAEWEF